MIAELNEAGFNITKNDSNSNEWSLENPNGEILVEVECSQEEVESKMLEEIRSHINSITNNDISYFQFDTEEEVDHIKGEFLDELQFAEGLLDYE